MSGVATAKAKGAKAPAEKLARQAPDGYHQRLLDHGASRRLTVQRKDVSESHTL